mmetsp:Transcript_16086/g.34772  ORF Transcript_16086/g.34772 Transcript_16086/m.34772 type:complete len:86 (-) Transcript_16086:76-333(-)
MLARLSLHHLAKDLVTMMMQFVKLVWMPQVTRTNLTVTVVLRRQLLPSNTCISSIGVSSSSLHSILPKKIQPSSSIRRSDANGQA